MIQFLCFWLLSKITPCFNPNSYPPTPITSLQATIVGDESQFSWILEFHHYVPHFFLGIVFFFKWFEAVQFHEKRNTFHPPPSRNFVIRVHKIKAFFPKTHFFFISRQPCWKNVSIKSNAEIQNLLSTIKTCSQRHLVAEPADLILRRQAALISVS